MSWFGSLLADVRIQAIQGNQDQALALLQKAVDEGWRVSWRFEMEHDMALSSLRQTPRYAEISKIISADMQRQRSSLEDASEIQ